MHQLELRLVNQKGQESPAIKRQGVSLPMNLRSVIINLELLITDSRETGRGKMIHKSGCGVHRETP